MIRGKRRAPAVARTGRARLPPGRGDRRRLVFVAENSGLGPVTRMLAITRLLVRE